jgi:hypothetical protein
MWARDRKHQKACIGRDGTKSLLGFEYVVGGNNMTRKISAIRYTFETSSASTSSTTSSDLPKFPYHGLLLTNNFHNSQETINTRVIPTMTPHSQVMPVWWKTLLLRPGTYTVRGTLAHPMMTDLEYGQEKQTGQTLGRLTKRELGYSTDQPRKVGLV